MTPPERAGLIFGACALAAMGLLAAATLLPFWPFLGCFFTFGKVC